MVLNKIPSQLKDCRFCKINKGEKGPFEKGWQKKIYSYDLISQYFPELNYGILCGYNQLGVLDDDTPDKRLMKLFNDNFKDTFQVRGHYYMKLIGWDCKKIIFYDGDEHLGELQGKGAQVVGPGSLHPSGETYELKKDLPIIEIEFQKFIEIFGKYIKKKKKYTEWRKKKVLWKGDDINQIPIQNIMAPLITSSSKNSNQGAHPIHGSNTGNNFVIYPSGGGWYCFRCSSGGGIWEAIAVSERMIDCSEANNYQFSENEKKEILKIAHEKYGLKYPKDENDEYEEIKKKCTTKLKDKSCPKCKAPLFSNLKFVYCKECKYFKSLKNYLKEKQ